MEGRADCCHAVQELLQVRAVVVALLALTALHRELQEPLLSYELHACWLALGALHEHECAEKLPGVVALLAPGGYTAVYANARDSHDVLDRSAPHAGILAANIASIRTTRPRDANVVAELGRGVCTQSAQDGST